MQRSVVIPNKMRDPFSFEEVLNLQDEIFSSRCVLDLSQLTFVEPYSMLSLLLLGRNYFRNSGEKLMLINIPVQIHQYLSRMDFFKLNFFTTPQPLNEKYMLKRSSFSSRVIEIIEIPNKERKSIGVINNVIALFRRRASHILRFWMNDSVIDYFVTVISELCQNIFEHSLDSGYLSMQTYSFGRENIFRLVISDSGIGIPQSFDSKKSVTYDSASDIIEKALTKPISSKRDFGFGLCQVNTIIKKMRGSIYIRSDDAFVTAMYQKRTRPGTSYIFSKNGLKQFNGTQITISLFA